MEKVQIDGSKLRELRVSHWLERQELAERADINRKTVEQIEGGKWPGGSRFSTVRKLAEALEVEPQELLNPGTAAVFACSLTLDGTIIRPGRTNDPGFRLTAWRRAQDADEQWGSCFYFVRPRVRTRVEILGADWYEQNLSIRGRLSLDTDQPVVLADQLPLQVRIRLETDGSPAWVVAGVQPSGIFTLQRDDFAGPTGARLRIQAWFDRTDLLASSRSNLVEILHAVPPVIG